NGGSTWSQSNTGLPAAPNADVEYFAIDPANHLTVYAGAVAVGAIGGGVFKSVNGGATWVSVGNVGTGLTNLNVFAVAVDPSNPQRIYAGTAAGGVFISADSGVTWTASNSGLTSIDVEALAIDPKNPAIVYAGSAAGVFKSTNYGAAWTSV